jgi:hypothetical protein
VVWVLQIILFKCVCGLFIDAVVFVTQRRSIGVTGSLVTFCDSTFWSLVIDVYTCYLIEDNY